MKHNHNTKNIKKETPNYLVNFDPLKNNWAEEVIKSEIPILFSCGDCKKFEKIFNKKYYEENLIFKVVKADFLNEKGKSKNPIPYFMLLIKGEVMNQFSSDSEGLEDLMIEVFEKIKIFSENSKNINYFADPKSTNNSNYDTPNISNKLNLSNLNLKYTLSMPIIQPIFTIQEKKNK